MIIINLACMCSLLIFVESRISWHASQVALKKLYDLQNYHFNLFNEYLDLESKRLEELKNHLTAMHEWRDHRITDKSTYTHNHINAMKMTIRIHQEQRKIEHLVDNKHSIDALKKIDENSDLSEDHIALSNMAIIRLQRFYGIPASDMAEGRYNDRIIGDPMNACECYILSKCCFEEFDMYGALNWAVQAHNKWKNGDRPLCVDIEQLTFYIISSSMYTGFDFTSILNENGFHYSMTNEMIAQHIYLMKDEILNPDDNNQVLDTFNVYDSLDIMKFDGIFKELCKRGKSNQTMTKDYKCRFQTKNSYYRILIPFKEEDIHHDPLIKIYHDVLYDDEIIKIKSISQDNMLDSEVTGDTTDLKVNEYFRLGQTSRINNRLENQQFNSLNTRIGTLTGYSLKSSEIFQVVNYGISGHFQPHYDAFNKACVDKVFGNRMFTVLFYLTDVHNDGYTSFPMLNIVCPVEKGSALVWHNLHMSNGSIIDSSLHGSCPILKGNKWIMTKWLREEGQQLLYNWTNNIENGVEKDNL